MLPAARMLFSYGMNIRSSVALALALAVVVLVATWLGFQSDSPTQVAAFQDRPGIASGLNNLELSPYGEFRWTQDTARICAAYAGWSARSVIELRLAGEYALSLGITQASIQANAGPSLPIMIAPKLRRYQILSGADQQVGADLCATISAAAIVDPNNKRLLGVPFYGAAFRHLPLAGPTLPAPAQLLLNLALAGLALGLLLLVGVPSLIAHGCVALVALVPALLLWSGLLPAGPGLVSLQLPLLGLLAVATLGLSVARSAAAWPALGRELAALIFWVAALVGVTWIVQAVHGHASVWPLKAGFDPHPTLLVLVTVPFCIGWLWLLLREPIRVPILRVALLLAGAVLIPVALEVSVFGWDALYGTFRDSPYEYLRDTARVAGDPLGFLRHYVDLAPTFALHSSTHPPGSVLLLWLIERVAGSGAVATSWTAILLSALLPLAAFWLGLRLGDLRLGLIAGAICVLMPGHMVYSVTSMDGVFNALNALAAVAFFLALESPARPRMAILAGALLALALFFTYATTQLAFFGLGAAAMALWRRPSWPSAQQIVRQGALTVGVIVLAYAAIFLLTGFNVLQASSAATAENARVMGRWLYGQRERPLLPPSMDYYLLFLSANITAYLWYLSPWGLTALGSELLASLRRGWRQADAFSALLVAAGVCLLGMWLSGLFNREVERIWGFTYPLAAVLIAHHTLSGGEQARHWRPWLYPLLFFAGMIVIKLLLDTVW